MLIIPRKPKKPCWLNWRIGVDFYVQTTNPNHPLRTRTPSLPLGHDRLWCSINRVVFGCIDYFMNQVSIGKEKAIQLAKTEWWKTVTPLEAFLFQMQTKELCMDFGDFQGVAEQVLGRPVWTLEFANPSALMAELKGEITTPTMEEIINKLPIEKRIIITI
jgi:hypothetical protein